MKVDNNTNLSFGKIKFSEKAMTSLSNRLPSGEFVQKIPELIEKHKINPIDIYVTTVKDSDRLFCQAKWISPNKITPRFFCFYKKEGKLNKIFSNPIALINRICKQSKKMAEEFSRKA